MLFVAVAVSLEINRKHYFQSDLCTKSSLGSVGQLQLQITEPVEVRKGASRKQHYDFGLSPSLPQELLLFSVSSLKVSGYS